MISTKTKVNEADSQKHPSCFFALTYFAMGFCLLLLVASLAQPQDFTSALFTTIMPTSPFFVLGALSLTQQLRHRTGGLIGAGFGALVAMSLPFGSLLLSMMAGDSTANIGAGLLLVIYPCFAPFLIVGGWAIGNIIHKSH